MKDRIQIVYEDRWFIIISKPQGLLSVGYPGFRGKTAQSILEDIKKTKGRSSIEVVHRLDRETSGIMMFALGLEAKNRMMNEWHDLVYERSYRCVCTHASLYKGGQALPDSGTIEAPLAYNKAHVAFVPRSDDSKALKNAEKAITHFTVIKRGSLYDLVECNLVTGRKNQIRAHLKHLGHPLAGDPLYGTKNDRLDRLYLHARVLAFTHPFTQEQHRFEESEPSSFLRLVQQRAKNSF